MFWAPSSGFSPSATVLSAAAQWNTVTVEATLTQIDALTRIDGVSTITLERGGAVKGGEVND